MQVRFVNLFTSWSFSGLIDMDRYSWRLEVVLAKFNFANVVFRSNKQYLRPCNHCDIASNMLTSRYSRKPMLINLEILVVIQRFFCPCYNIVHKPNKLYTFKKIYLVPEGYFPQIADAVKHTADNSSKMLILTPSFKPEKGTTLFFK